MPIILFKENTGDLVISLGENIYLKVSQQIKDLRVLANDLMTTDSEIYIRIRNKDIKAKVVKMPFYKK